MPHWQAESGVSRAELGRVQGADADTQSYAYARVLDGKAVVAVYNNGDSPVSMEFQLPVEASGVEDCWPTVWAVSPS